MPFPSNYNPLPIESGGTGSITPSAARSALGIQIPLPATSVTFTQSGTGAVARSVQDKERDVVSVKDFGAKGDGVTDDTAAIIAAIAAANISAGADGINRTVVAPAGTYQISGQIVLPTTVSLRGEGINNTRIRCSGTFAGLTTTGAIRIGSGAGAIFGTMVEDLMVECSAIAGSVGVYSSDVQDAAGVRNVLVNNFVGYGVRFDGSGGSFGSVNNFVCEHCQALKADSGGAGGVGFSFENGSLPGLVFSNSAYGHVANPLTSAFQAIAYPLSGSGFVCDGAGTNGVLLSTNVFTAFLSAITTNGFTNSLNITTTGKVCASAIFRAGGTNTVNDAGNSGTAKTITDLLVPLYARGTAGPVDFDQLDLYSRLRIAGTSGSNALTIDKPGAIGTGRFGAYVGDGTGGSNNADSEAYFSLVNTILHIIKSGTAGDLFTMDNLGILSSKNKIFPGTDAAAIQTAAGLYAGTGVPNNANGANGDIYFRSDGGAGTTIYQRRAGAWVATGA